MTERGSVQEFTRPQLASVASIMLTETIREFRGSIPHAATRTALNCRHSQLYSAGQLKDSLTDDSDSLKRVAANLRISTGNPRSIREIANNVFDLAQQMIDVPDEELQEFLKTPIAEKNGASQALHDEASALGKKYRVKRLISEAAQKIEPVKRIA